MKINYTIVGSPLGRLLVGATHRGISALPQHVALSEDVLRLACDDLAARRCFRAIFFIPGAVFILVATIIIANIVDASSTAIPGSARNPRPAAAKRRFAGGSGAQSQSKKGCGKGQGVHRR